MLGPFAIDNYIPAFSGIAKSLAASTFIDRVPVFDASAPGQLDTATGGPFLPAIGTINMPALPKPISPCTPFEISIAGCFHGNLQVSPPGSTLVWPSFRHFVVITVPQNLRPRVAGASPDLHRRAAALRAVAGL